MRFMLRGRSILGVVGLAVGSLALVASTAGATVATPAPTLVVHPDTGLAKNPNVHVNGSHYKAEEGQTVYIVECVNTATTEAGCDIAGVGTATISSTGALPRTKFQVHEKFTNGGNTRTTCNANGDASGGCAIVVANSAMTELAAAPISFAS